MLIQRAALLDGRMVDIRVQDTIEAVEDSVTPTPGEVVHDAANGLVIPGLHDHHVHLYSAAAERYSLRVGHGEVHGRDDLARVLGRAEVGEDGWIRAVGYHETVAGPLDRSLLDEISPPVPVRVQHRSGVLWTLNTRGLIHVGLPDHPDGRLRSADRSWVESLERRETRLGDLGRRLLGYGVTGVTDATPDLDLTGMVRLREARRQGELRQHVHVLAPGKRILHDDDLDLEELIDWIGDRHRRDVPVAVHCVTAAQLLLTIAALRAAGSHPQDRIEHAAVVGDDALGDLAELGVTVVTQPNFVAERGDQYLTDVPPEEHPQLWRLASLLRAGIAVALSTDMPFGDADPWHAIRSAVHRRTAGGAVLGPQERISARDALSMFFGLPESPTSVRTIAPGQPGDVCVLALPPEDALAELTAEAVSATIIAGHLSTVE